MSEVQTLSTYWSDETGVMRLERWPEGFVIWFGGKTVFKSWEQKSKTQTIKLDIDTKQLQRSIQAHLLASSLRRP